MTKYARGLQLSLKNQFGRRFLLLDDLLSRLVQTLPHVSCSAWTRLPIVGWTGATLKGQTGNKVIKVSLAYVIPAPPSRQPAAFQLCAELKKGRAFGQYERAFINSLAQQIGKVTSSLASSSDDDFLAAPEEVIDVAVADFLCTTIGNNDADILGIVRYLKSLALQSYETKQITYGVLVLPRQGSKRVVAKFPDDVVNQKRFQALTDGYKTALVLDTEGKILNITSLKQAGTPGEHFRPIWLDPMADTATRLNALGIALTRTGSILVSWRGNLLLSYRLGKWMLWHHSENVQIVESALKARDRRSIGIGRLAARLYRCALDVSFRRSGGLFVTLNTPQSLGSLVPPPEQLNGNRRNLSDRALGEWLAGKTIIGIDREVISDLAALDGAIVVDKSGSVLSYGAVLSLPMKKGLGQIEGSRSRAAHSASYVGVSIKVSSDGGIDVIKRGKKLLSL
jgi:hypothetical protein